VHCNQSFVESAINLYPSNQASRFGFLCAMTGPVRFTISEVAVDWQEPMVLQHTLWPSDCTH